MTLLKMDDYDYENMTLGEFNKLFDKNMKVYYKKHFKNNKNVEKEIYELSNKFFLNSWNAYAILIFLVYCISNYKKTPLYLNEIPEETKNQIDFFFNNYEESLSLYDAILDRLLKVTEKFDKNLNNLPRNNFLI